MSTSLQMVIVYTCLLMALINLVRRQWLVNMGALALQYGMVFLLLITFRNPSLGIIKLLVGLMVTLVLYLTLVSLGTLQPLQYIFRFSLGEIFRGLAGIFMIIAVTLFTPGLRTEVFPLTSLPVLTASLGLVILGLLQLGMITEPLYVIIGLLTFLSGFELLYGSMEFSTVLEALFAAVNLGLALVGAYIIVKDEEPETR
ncbi:MAG TPA: hypothetical protein PKK90_05945 [Anaerolineaceae bacterium]|jgi:hypothetical protein|nr:hypothetical protein [Anaerolineaceae bacterium]HPT23598.1 hypothetical protein [Anaerolineaceae bacterium]